MPLRVAEYSGYIRAVNNCPECPFVVEKRSDDMAETLGWECIYHVSWREPPKEKDPGKEVYGAGIPVWCPLPRREKGSWIITEEKFHSLLDEVINHIKTTEPPKTMTEFMVRQENAEETIKMRGKHPENIVWDAPEEETKPPLGEKK